MSLILKFTLVFLLCISVHGVILPGSCPITPPTHDIALKTLYDHTVIRVVPFSSQKPTYLFRPISQTDIWRYQLVLSQERAKLFRFVFFPTKEIPLRSFMAHVLDYGPSYTINSTIVFVQSPTEYLPVSCYPAIVEDVKFWQGEGYFFIWSCVNATKNSHDEALMIAYRHSIQDLNREETEELINNISKTAQKYMLKPLLSQIDWKYYKFSQSDLVEDDSYDPFECDPDGNGDNKFIYYVVAGVLLVCVIGGHIWYILKNEANGRLGFHN